MAQASTQQVSKTLLASGTITINPADFSAISGGYHSHWEIGLDGFYQAGGAKGIMTGSIVPSYEVYHVYNFTYGLGGTILTDFKQAPYTDFVDRNTGQVAEQLSCYIETNYTAANDPQQSAFLEGDYFTSSNSISTPGSSYYTQYILYTLWSPSYVQ